MEFIGQASQFQYLMARVKDVGAPMDYVELIKMYRHISHIIIDNGQVCIKFDDTSLYKFPAPAQPRCKRRNQGVKTNA